MTHRIITGNVLPVLQELPAGMFQCCVTSPPYWGLRDYGVEGQLGLEKTPEEYVEKMVEVFREVRRVLRKDGTCWLNIGDSYARDGGAVVSPGATAKAGNTLANLDTREQARAVSIGLKPKDLVLIPYRLVLALQADGWWVRSHIVWAKTSCMPEAVRDRPTNSWEPIFLLTKSQKYYYDADAVRVQHRDDWHARASTWRDGKAKGLQEPMHHPHKDAKPFQNPPNPAGANLRNVWTIGPENFREAHFATFPTEIPRKAILAGTSAHGCCVKCSAPWKRRVERSSVNRSNAAKAGNEDLGGKGHVSSQVRENHDIRNGPTSVVETIGWEPTCDCETKDVHPCLVLDPFAGAATTGVVAEELGRNSVLVELNPEYVEISEKRIEKSKTDLPKKKIRYVTITITERQARSLIDHEDPSGERLPVAVLIEKVKKEMGGA